MNQLEEEVLEKELIESEKSIVVYNDDFHTFDYVIETLIKVCQHDLIQAEQCTYLIHYTGRCIVKRGNYQKLEPLCSALLEKGLTAEID